MQNPSEVLEACVPLELDFFSRAVRRFGWELLNVERS
jgi:hypothetical protein